MTVVSAPGGSDQVVVPARPRAAAPRQHPHVGVQHRLVALVGDRAQDLVLAVGGVAEQAERLVGVRGHDDLVEALGLAAAGRDQHVVAVAADRCDRRRQPQPARGTARGAPRRSGPSRRGRSASAAVRAPRACRGCRRTRPGSGPGRSTSGADRPTTRPTPAARSAGR